jgi:hypothetical protein
MMRLRIGLLLLTIWYVCYGVFCLERDRRRRGPTDSLWMYVLCSVLIAPFRDIFLASNVHPPDACMIVSELMLGGCGLAATCTAVETSRVLWAFAGGSSVSQFAVAFVYVRRVLTTPTTPQTTTAEE